MDAQQAHKEFDTMVGVAKLALHLGDRDTALQVLRNLTDNDEVIDALYDEDHETENEDYDYQLT